MYLVSLPQGYKSKIVPGMLGNSAQAYQYPMLHDSIHKVEFSYVLFYFSYAIYIYKHKYIMKYVWTCFHIFTCT